MRKIFFNNFVIQDGYFSCLFCDDLDSKVIEFDLNVKFEMDNDLIALSLSTLCGRNNYDEIYFDLDLSSSMVLEIEKFCHSKIYVKSSSYVEILKENKSNLIGLNFSGGFDSLAAKNLMPGNTILLSMDFGGRFSRERVFFKKFKPYIVKTNLLETHLKRNSWAFMGIASILYSKYLDLKYISFGGILEASASNFSENPIAARMNTFEPFKSAQLITAPFVIGITEIGTAMIIDSFMPDFLFESLESLANNGEEKKYRKQLIMDAIFNRNSSLNTIAEFNLPNNKTKFGLNFTNDFLLFYLFKYCKESLILNLYEDVPDEVVYLSKKLSLNFYERINTNFLERFPNELIDDFMARLNFSKISFYTKNDWIELDLVLNVLKKYHKF